MEREMKNPGHGRGPDSGDPFPAGLRVLVVDDDPTCLMILERMLTTCLYRVTKCNRAEMALSLLRKNKNGFDIVISDVYMPDMDGFKLLEHIGLEMDLPVIMMSADDSKSVVLKGVTHGAVDYLIKPVRMDALKNIWQHVVRKKRNEWNVSEETGGDRHGQQREDADNNSSPTNWRSSRKRKEEEVDDTSSLKKPRVVWSVELHQQFVAAVNQLGIDKAVPKKILEMMNVPGLTRENVASHLQKYRIYLRRLGGISQLQGNMNHSFMTGQDPNFGHHSMLKGFDLEALAFAGQRSISSFENPRGGHAQMMNNDNNQMNLFHGVPMMFKSSDVKGMNSSVVTNPSYYDDFPKQQQHHILNDWDMQNIGFVFDSHQDTTAVVEYANQIYMGSGSVRVKSETVICPRTTTSIHEQYNQDLISAFLKQEGIPTEFDLDNIHV